MFYLKKPGLASVLKDMIEHPPPLRQAWSGHLAVQPQLHIERKTLKINQTKQRNPLSGEALDSGGGGGDSYTVGTFDYCKHR